MTKIFFKKNFHEKNFFEKNLHDKMPFLDLQSNGPTDGQTDIPSSRDEIRIM